MSEIQPRHEMVAPPARPTAPAYSPLPAPGWMNDPNVPGGKRWWDGRGWSEFRQAPAAAPQVVVNAPQKRPVNHALHLVLSILTFGLWLPVWLIIAVAA